MSHRVEWIQRWLNQKRWGFRLYRCTFGDDEAWNKFVAILDGMVTDHLALTDCNREQREKWHLDVISDTELDNADWVKLRQHFLAWADSEAINEELTDNELQRRAELPPLQQYPGSITRRAEAPRYTNFLYVDEESMRSVLKADENGDWESAFVIAIDSWEKFKTFPRNLEEDKEGRELAFDVGYSMRIPPGYIPILYTDLIKGLAWQEHFYAWPPEIYREG
jgi:hypothetical protein